MYELVREVGLQSVVGRESVYLLMALGIAEMFYKFHSFSLEAIAFLATWYALSWGGSKLLTRRSRE